MTERADDSEPEDEHIRRTVGTPSTPDNPVRRVWRLRERMLHLGIEFGDDDERIRKVVGGEESDEGQ